MLLSECKASVLRRYPFTIILKESHATATPRPLRLKIYPASKTTGLAVINESTAEVVWAAELKHRSQLIKKALESRRSLRNGRRSRKTRYRPPRWSNRKRTGPPVLSSANNVIHLGKWLPPSLQHRIEVIMTWVHRLRRYLPITAISQELVRFDTQKIQNQRSVAWSTSKARFTVTNYASIYWKSGIDNAVTAERKTLVWKSIILSHARLEVIGSVI